MILGCEAMDLRIIREQLGERIGLTVAYPLQQLLNALNDIEASGAHFHFDANPVLSVGYGHKPGDEFDRQ